jgi:hypothetical protein
MAVAGHAVFDWCAWLVHTLTASVVTGEQTVEVEVGCGFLAGAWGVMFIHTQSDLTVERLCRYSTGADPCCELFGL